MTTDIAVIQKKDVEVAQKLDIDIDLYRALRYSLFPDQSIPEIAFGMYLAYCKSKNYDPLKKPMHIVMISSKTGKKGQDGKDIYEKNPTIMPGIISYRIDAVRTGTFFGVSDIEFGPMITKTFGKDNKKVEFPEWGRIVIYKKIGDVIREIPAKLYWIECYALKDQYSDEPNKMWSKRPRAMLEKCCEALAYRKGFPEEIGAIPTHEEMEGRDNHFSVIEGEFETDTPKKQDIPLSLEMVTEPEVLQKHLDAINNSTTWDELKILYSKAKEDTKGDKDASNKISVATKERQSYIKQLREAEEAAQKGRDEFLAAYSGETKNA